MFYSIIILSIASDMAIDMTLNIILGMGEEDGKGAKQNQDLFIKIV